MPDDNLMQRVLEIPEIVSGEDERCQEVIHTCISLKQLYTREEMDRHHVDCLILYQIALRVLHVMEELAARDICPGLYALEDLYVDPKTGWRLYLLHPERFQLGDKEQDYEWYPEDERVFADRTFFDFNLQRLADCRLLYKILTAASKGNVRIPPKETRADYSTLFYKTLPPELKDIFIREEAASHERLRGLIEEAIALERESARLVRDRLKEQTIQMMEEAEPPVNHAGESADIYTMFVLLRTETSHSGRISRMLYQEMDRLELDTSLTGAGSHLAFVYGDGFVQARGFAMYPDGFRIQLAQSIRDYSSAETITIACELIKNEMRNAVHPDAEYELCLITDGRLKNDRMFSHALKSLDDVRGRGCRIRFIQDPDFRCEACDRLADISSDGSVPEDTGAGK